MPVAFCRCSSEAAMRRDVVRKAVRRHYVHVMSLVFVIWRGSKINKNAASQNKNPDMDWSATLGRGRMKHCASSITKIELMPLPRYIVVCLKMWWNFLLRDEILIESEYLQKKISINLKLRYQLGSHITLDTRDYDRFCGHQTISQLCKIEVRIIILIIVGLVTFLDSLHKLIYFSSILLKPCFYKFTYSNYNFCFQLKDSDIYNALIK